MKAAGVSKTAVCVHAWSKDNGEEELSLKKVLSAIPSTQKAEAGNKQVSPTKLNSFIDVAVPQLGCC